MSSTTGADAPLAGRSAVVSGASRGIGRETALALHALGARVVLLGRDTEALSEIVRRLRQPGATALRIDFANRDSTRDGIASLRAQLGSAPDILVNNAGRFLLASAEQTAVDDFEEILAINLTAQFALVREFVGDMRARRSGHIVTIGSIADHVALRGNAAYSASKFGARALHEVLREELRGTGVRATLVSPARVDTTIWNDVDARQRAALEPQAGMLAAADVARAVCYAVTSPALVNVDEIRLSRA